MTATKMLITKLSSAHHPKILGCNRRKPALHAGFREVLVSGQCGQCPH